MKFFKKKSNKQNIDYKHHSSDTKSHEKEGFSETRKTNSESSLLQLNLLDDFSSTINIPQLFCKGNIETAPENNNISGDKTNASTVQRDSAVFSVIVNENTTSPLPTNDNMRGGFHEEKGSIEVKSQSNHYGPQENDVLILDIIASDESQNNACDPLTDPEGDAQLTPDNRISPLKCEMDVTTKLGDDIDENCSKKVQTVDISYSEHLQDVMKSEIYEENHLKEEDNQPAPDTLTMETQPIIKLQQNNSATTTTDNSCNTPMGVIEGCEAEFSCEESKQTVETVLVPKMQNERDPDSWNILKPNINELISEKSTPQNIFYSEQNTAIEDKDSAIKASKDENILEDTEGQKIEKRPKAEKVDVKAEIEESCLEKETEGMKMEESRRKESVSVKRKSVQSFIPRKQIVKTQIFADSEASHNIEGNSPLPINTSPSTSTSSPEIQNDEHNAAARRGSSSSFLPITSLPKLIPILMADAHDSDNTISHSSCSPSSSSDSLLKTPPRSLLISESTSTSGRNNAENTIHEKKKATSSIQQQSKSSTSNDKGKPRAVCISHSSKIPVFATLQLQNQQNDRQKASASASSRSVISRLPVKRNPTVV